ncbi:hypothetical protein Pst134EB_012276 [Puccinia striiformis f. sp. tritici]|uniref:Xylulose kinase n=1 Tax=Puccinia striiformis f. sp. tritici PST-78 TaxID=1165861 RepID=A0A0L0V2E3_9BASI|nr:hypothetical protein Pst134EB_012276 [Puccinia striiformis f. sp. tritici]KNE93361.1 hypothetical protein PSTG_13302 [Puccinia striiformis f. sp. tritici PST-78]
MVPGTDQPPSVASPAPRDVIQAHQKPYFLSLDLSTEKMGLIVVDESMDVIFGECVKFDTDLPEYGTQNGCHTDGEVSTSPTHSHVKALDILLQKVSSQIELKRVKCIGGSAQQHNSVWWSKAASTLLSRLTPNKPLYEQLPPEQTWTLPNPPNFYDMSTDAQAQSLEWLIGGPEETARRSGVRAFCRFTGVQIMKVQQTRPNILEATDRISSASSFLSSLLLGSIAPLSESDAASMSLWNMNEQRWDPLVLNFIMGKDSSLSEPSSESAKLIQKLGEPYLDNSVPLGPIASYFVRRYGFSADCQIVGFVGHHQATLLSQRLQPRDVMICLGDCDSDSVLLPLPHYLPDPTRQILPSPLKSPSDVASEKAFMALLEYKDADLARHFLRDTYCNGSWHTFDTLVTLISEGGTIGLDDKLYTFFWPHGELGSWQGISRFESGQRIKEFKDQRVNPRSLLESQFLTMRLQLSRISQGLRLLDLPHGTLAPAYSSLGFDPYDHSVLPQRIIVTGKAAGSRVMTELLSSIIGIPVYRSLPLSPSTYSTVFLGNQLAITPAALGSCYKAAWTYIRQFNVDQSYDDFLKERNIQRAKRLRSSDTRNNSMSLISTSLSQLGASEASVTSPQPDHRASASFSSANPASLHWNEEVSSPELFNDSTMPSFPILTDSKDVEDGLKKVAEPDEDSFQRYGGQLEEFARLENCIRRGVL